MSGVVAIPLFTSKLIARGFVDVAIVTGLIADHGVYWHDFVAGTVCSLLHCSEVVATGVMT